jgi:anti-sigma-K factor RskA
MSDRPDRDDDRLLAGEYVLGTLDEDQRREVRRRAAREPALAALIAAWERDLAPLAGGVEPVAPPPALWDRIEAAIAPVADETTTLASPPLRAYRLAGRPAAPGGFWRGAGVWRASTVVSLALAAGLAAVAFLPRQTRPDGFAALAPAGAPGPAFLVRALPNGALLVTAVNAPTAPTGHDLELWVLAPASLGVLPVTGRVFTPPTTPTQGSQLMISLEPPGGSPTGVPTGPVVYGGKLANI